MKITALIVFFLAHLNAQQYSVKLVSPVQTSDRTFQFDVVLSSDSMYLTSYQCAFKYNTAVGDSLAFSYLPNTSQLINIPNVVGIYDDPLVNRKKLAFGSNAGGEVIKGEKRIGTFMLSSMYPFNTVLPEISWALNDAQYIRTILTGRNFENITNWLWFSDLQYNIPLPVQLTSLEAKQTGDSVLVSWLTMSETNSYGFSILANDVKVGFLPGAGNSNSPKHYKFYHLPAGSGKYSYKIAMIDANGSVEYSNIVIVYFEKDEAKDEDYESCWLFPINLLIKLFSKIF